MGQTAIYAAAQILDTWVNHDWSQGIQVESLPSFTEIFVQTRNTITIIDGASREVLIRGGKYFPEKVAARVSGSSLGGSFLKVGGIYAGFSMEIQAGGTPIVTTPVRSIHVYSCNPRD